MIFANIAALILVAQQASDVVVARYPDELKTWTIRYPSSIGPLVEEYYNCLKGGSYEVGDGKGFAEQYQDDILRCDEVGSNLQREAELRLSQRSQANELPAEASNIFESVRNIHLARGAALDSMVGINLASSEQTRDRNRAAPNPVCIARVADLRQRRQAFAEKEGASVEALHRKENYSDDDRRVILTYSNELLRLTSLMQVEMSRCPGSEIGATTSASQVPDYQGKPPAPRTPSSSQ